MNYSTFYDSYPQEHILTSNVEYILPQPEAFVGVYGTSIKKIRYKMVYQKVTVIDYTLTFSENSNVKIMWNDLSSQPFYITHITVEDTSGNPIVLRTAIRASIC